MIHMNFIENFNPKFFYFQILHKKKYKMYKRNKLTVDFKLNDINFDLSYGTYYYYFPQEYMYL